MQQFGDPKVIEAFKEYVKKQTSDLYDLVIENDETILLKTDYATGTVNFWDMGICELIIKEPEKDDYAFYLHFEMNDLEHAIELYEEMEETIIEMATKQGTRILFCCTGGLTTGFFAAKMNEAAKVLDNDYYFEATSYHNVYQMGRDFDAVFLAPQIQYELEKIESVLSNQLVDMIPATIFAKFEPGKMMEYIEKDLEEYEKSHTTKQEIVAKQYNNNKKVLVLGFTNSFYSVKFAYRYYKNGQVEVDGAVVKPKITFRDVTDIIDTMRIRFPEIEQVAFAIPGVLGEEEYIFEPFTSEHPDFYGYLKERYPDLPIYLLNDMNAVAYGIYQNTEDNRNMVFYFQPDDMAFGSIGIIKDGEVLMGHNNSVGELFFMAPMINKFIPDPMELLKTPEGTAQFMMPYIAGIITINGPDKIYFHTQLVPETEYIVENLRKYIPDMLLPEFEKVDDYKEAMLSGVYLHWLAHQKKV